MLNLGTTDAPKSIPTVDMITGGGGGGGSALIEFDEATETISIAPAEARFFKPAITAWSSGTVTVEGSSNYTAFAVKSDGIAVLMHCYREGSFVRGVGAYPEENGTYMITVEFVASVSADDPEDWTYVMCSNRRHNVDGHGNSMTKRTVSAIYGEY